MEQKKPKPLTVEQLLDRQNLVVAKPQARLAGMSSEAWRHRITSRRWQSPVPGIAIAHTGTPEPLQWRWVSVLHGGEDAALTGDAALVHFGVKRLAVAQHDLAVPTDRRVVDLHLPELTVVTHSLRHLEKWTAGHPHLRLVHVHAATLHAAAWAPSDEEAEYRITLAVQQRLTNPTVLRISLEQMPRLPRHALILEVLIDVEHGATAQSELDFLRFLRRNGLPEPDEMQLRVRAGGTTRYLDAYYRGKRIIIEIDGAYHRWAKQWDADAMRTLQLAVANRDTGEQVIRITRAMMRHKEPETAALLRELLLG